MAAGSPIRAAKRNAENGRRGRRSRRVSLLGPGPAAADERIKPTRFGQATLAATGVSWWDATVVQCTIWVERRVICWSSVKGRQCAESG